MRLDRVNTTYIAMNPCGKAKNAQLQTYLPPLRLAQEFRFPSEANPSSTACPSDEKDIQKIGAEHAMSAMMGHYQVIGYIRFGKRRERSTGTLSAGTACELRISSAIDAIRLASFAKRMRSRSSPIKIIFSPPCEVYHSPGQDI